MKYEPLVTIVIPVYNGSNYMKEAIDSALSQTYKNIEIIVVNDGSNDNGATENIALSYGDRIRYIRKDNGGVSSAINLAIDNMNGRWLSWLSHDDVYKPNKIETQIEYLNDKILKCGEYNIEKICLYSATERINADGVFISRKKNKIPKNMTPIDSLIFNIKRYSIGGCTVLISKYILDNVGSFNESIRTVSDADLWFRVLLANYNFEYINKILVKSRQHKQQVGNKSIDLFEKEHSILMDRITNELLKLNLTSKQKYKLLEGLLLNGFDNSANNVRQNIKKNHETKLIYEVKLITYIKFRKNMYFTIRKIYRKITLK